MTRFGCPGRDPAPSSEGHPETPDLDPGSLRSRSWVSGWSWSLLEPSQFPTVPESNFLWNGLRLASEMGNFVFPSHEEAVLAGTRLVGWRVPESSHFCASLIGLGQRPLGGRCGQGRRCSPLSSGQVFSGLTDHGRSPGATVTATRPRRSRGLTQPPSTRGPPLPALVLQDPERATSNRNHRRTQLTRKEAG